MFDWVTGFIDQFGYLGIFVLTFAENVFPPIPSELIMPLAGYTAARGDLDAVLVVLSGAVGSLCGAVLWYYVGRWVGCERLKRFAGKHGHWLTLSPTDIDDVRHWFDRHSGKAVLIGRLVPGVRTLISIPAGIAEMPLPRFLIFSATGTLIWTALLTGAGYLLESQYHYVADYLNPVTNIIVGVALVGYLYRVITRKAARSSSGS